MKEIIPGEVEDGNPPTFYATGWRLIAGFVNR
jgi:hypothetical protein